MAHNTKSIFILERTFIIFNTYLTMAFIGLTFDQIFLDSFQKWSTLTATVFKVVVAGRCIWSQSVLRCASVSVALMVRPRDGTALAQCGNRRVTGLRNTRPWGPHITSGDSIASPKVIFRLVHGNKIGNAVDLIWINMATLWNYSLTLVISLYLVRLGVRKRGLMLLWGKFLKVFGIFH